MAFRDETEALRAHIALLEEELERAREELARLESVQASADRLARRVAELEEELGQLRESPSARATRQRRERLEQTEREAAEHRAQEEAPAASAGVGSEGSHRAAIGVLVGVLAIGGAAMAVALNDCGPEPWRASDAPPTIGTVELATAPLPATFEGTTDDARGTPQGCEGYVPDAPHLAIVTPAGATLVLEVTAREDTVLLLVASDGTVRCDDDSGGNYNPRLITNVPAGRHRVWVGTYEQSDPARFTLTVGGMGPSR